MNTCKRVLGSRKNLCRCCYFQKPVQHSLATFVMRGVPALVVLLLVSLTFANITERRENQYLQSRSKVRIDEGWKILAGSNPSGAKDSNFSDAGWTTTN